MTRFPKPNRQHDDEADRFVKGVAPAAPAPAAKPDVSRLTVDIPTDLHRRLKATCATSGTTMGDTIAIMIRNWLDKGQHT